MNQTSLFLSCDWGTSSFRLRLVDSENFLILAQRLSDEGNAITFQNWKSENRPEGERLAFYQKILHKHLNELEKETGNSLTGLPIIISGMASSTIGMMELPYKELPFKIDGSDMSMERLYHTPELKNPVFLISGAKTQDDVMRGEETQLIGCILEDKDHEQLFIHPGTHSKHIVVKNGKAIMFKTYMTGELYSVLSEHSILASSVAKADDISDPGNLKEFLKGVKDASSGNLMHLLFMVRTNDLFEKIASIPNSFYLSGLLIGTELSSFPEEFTGRAYVAGEEKLVDLYCNAIKALGIERNLKSLTVMNAEEITVRGQFEIFSKSNLI
jgi:2-dehydro-3-deoxygalactonokinase